jgi:hypothetical protein
MDAALRGSPAGAAETVVTISRQLASGGAYIGQRLAQRLGFRYVDREILTRAAAALGLDDEQSASAAAPRTRPSRRRRRRRSTKATSSRSSRRSSARSRPPARS